MNKMARGKFIAIDGLDGSGKSTQAALLANHLNKCGVPTILTAEPYNATLIRKVLNEEIHLEHPMHLALLFLADRVEHLATKVMPALERGDWVVCDRYVLSTMAYQTLRIDFDDMARLNATFLVPDIYIYLDLPIDMSVERLIASGKKPDMYERREVLEKVRANYYKAIRWYEEKCDARIDMIYGGAKTEDVLDSMIRSVLP